MEFIYIFLIITCLLFIGLIITTIFIFKKITDKSKIKVNILLKSKNFARFKISSKKVSDLITFNKGKYNFDENAVVRGKFFDEIYFYEGNPNPIRFDFKNSDVGVYSSKDLKNILDSDLIQKLFNENQMEKMKLVLFIILGVGVLILIGVIGNIFIPSNITGEVNKQFITEIVRNVLTGGK